MTHLVVFSHLRWNFVYQRPQHLLSRLARHYPVVYVEEPLPTAGEAYLKSSQPSAGIEVLRPYTPVGAPGFHDDQLASLDALLGNHWPTSIGDDDYVVWFYTPMALPLLGDLRPRAIVYDCMDELSHFKNAPRQMRQRETALLKLADVVLTGGPSLYEAKRALHPRTICLPSAVDADHYALDPSRIDPARAERAADVQGSTTRPRLGFFGVIDERFDVPLLAQMAEAEPDWEFVMVGPVVKIDPAALPRNPNIRWLGQQPYELLPYLIADWDICLMPFAMNESTRFISPTKTLEYLAAGKPIVSTPVRDVIGMFGDVVRVAPDADGFLQACRDVLALDPSAQRSAATAAQARARQHSWENAAATAHQAVEEALRLRPSAPPASESGGTDLSSSELLPKVASMG